MVLHGPSTAVSTTTVLFVLTTWSEHPYINCFQVF